MILAMLLLWLVSAILILREYRISRSILYLAIFSLFSAACFLILGSPDVAMAEAAISSFTTVFFVVCFERYLSTQSYTLRDPHPTDSQPGKPRKLKGWNLFNLFLTISIFALFIKFIPGVEEVNSTLKYFYIHRFMGDVGGENPVTSIYLAYRVYDTLFEALMLVVSVVAVIHLSYFDGISIKKGKPSEIETSSAAGLTLRLVCPAMLVFGIYLIVNGHLSPGGGFQGGLAVASFFVCRYMIYDIYDISISKLNKMEELIFAGITVVAALVVFQQGLVSLIPQQHILLFQNVYLITMNVLIGLKVACAFVILFYRYIGIERQ